MNSNRLAKVLSAAARVQAKLPTQHATLIEIPFLSEQERECEPWSPSMWRYSIIGPDGAAASAEAPIGNFNDSTAGQQSIIAGGANAYQDLAGSDGVSPPSEANYSESARNASASSSNDLLTIAGTTMPSNPIGGFVPGSGPIELASIGYANITSASLNPSTDKLTVVYGTGNTAVLQLSGNYQNSSISLSSDGNGGTDIINLGVSPQVDPVTAGSQIVFQAGSGIVFNNTFTGNVTQAYENCILAAENTIASTWTNSATIYETFDAEAEGQTGVLADNSWYTITVSYSTLVSALASLASTENNPYMQQAVASLPATDPSGGQGFHLPLAYAEMLGLTTLASAQRPDTVTLNTSYDWTYGQDVINTVEHEISEGGMGRVGGLGDQNNHWSTMDLFRYNAAGQPDYSDGRDGEVTYFSYNGGATLSQSVGLSFNNQYNQAGQRVNTGDTADFTERDVFGTGMTGETNTLSQTDIEIMDVLGWDPATSGLSVTSISAVTNNGTNIVGAGNIVTVTLQTNEVAIVTGTPSLQLNDNEVANYVSGSGSVTLTFSYTVQANDASPGSYLQVTGINLPSGSSIQDSSGNNLTDSLTGDLGIQLVFAVDDATTNSPFSTAGQPYTGSVLGLIDQYIYTGADNLNVTAQVPNVFIHTGDGEDAIDVSHVGGTNVLDGGTNSNFLVGGTGANSFDTFFVDDRSPPADIWSTVVNFHSGDAATIFGITPNGFATSWVDGQGAAGYTGLTLHVTAPGVPTASITLSGYTTADLTDGALTTTWGTETDGTPYLYIQANGPSGSTSASMSQLAQAVASFGASTPGDSRPSVLPDSETTSQLHLTAAPH